MADLRYFLKLDARRHVATVNCALQIEKSLKTFGTRSVADALQHLRSGSRRGASNDFVALHAPTIDRVLKIKRRVSADQSIRSVSLAIANDTDLTRFSAISHLLRSYGKPGSAYSLRR